MHSNKAKHSKIRNTGLLFEFLLRQITTDVLNKKDNSKAVELIKKRFNENTSLGKELSLYSALLNTKFKTDKKAEFFINEVLSERNKINKTTDVENPQKLTKWFVKTPAKNFKFSEIPKTRPEAIEKIIQLWK